jgi:hypothetical protein
MLSCYSCVRLWRVSLHNPLVKGITYWTNDYSIYWNTGWETLSYYNHRDRNKAGKQAALSREKKITEQTRCEGIERVTKEPVCTENSQRQGKQTYCIEELGVDTRFHLQARKNQAVVRIKICWTPHFQRGGGENNFSSTLALASARSYEFYNNKCELKFWRCVMYSYFVYQCFLLFNQ